MEKKINFLLKNQYENGFYQNPWGLLPCLKRYTVNYLHTYLVL